MQEQALAPRNATPRRRQRAQVSCTECRRRKQKCNPRKDGPCGNCVRRYPPVECYVLPDPRAPKQAHGTNPTSLAVGFSNKLPPIVGPNASSARSSASGDQYVPLPPTLDPWTHDHRAHQTPSYYQISRDSSDRSSSSVPLSAGLEEAYAKPVFDDEARESIERASDNTSNSDSRIVARRSSSPYGSPRPFGGALAAINTLNGLPIEPNMRNAELFRFFHEFVAPSLCSVDGQNLPALFVRDMLPWMIQSPLMPNIAILMASATQAEHGLGVTKHSETLRIKSRVLALITGFLKQDFRVVGGEALRAVIHLVVLEWFWGTPSMIWPHMEGMKQMMKLRGGFAGMNDPVLQSVIILTDYELANCFEAELFLLGHDERPEYDMPIPASYAEALRSPLLAYPTNFDEDRELLGLNAATAEILEDVRFLTLSITSTFSEAKDTEKIQSTAAWLKKRLETHTIPSIGPGTPSSQIIFSAVLLTAQIYSTSISTLTPTSAIYTPLQFLQMQSYISLVGLSSWKDMPGIFLWILLVAAPSAGNDHQGRFFRRKMAVTGMTVGMDDFGLAIGQLRAFWKVQRWVASERERARVKREVDE